MKRLVFAALAGGATYGGEAATAPVIAAVGNAIFALTGKRVRRLPFSDGLALA